MGDMGDIFRDMREFNKERRHQNLERGLERLKESGVDFKMLSPDHVRVSGYDYWPSTGLFIEMKTKRRGRGIGNLLKVVRITKTTEAGHE